MSIAGAEPVRDSDIDVGLVYDLTMPTAVLTTEENTLPNSYSATSGTFDEVMRVAITPESADALCRLRLTPHFFRTDSRVTVYWRVVRKVAGQADVTICDQVQVTTYGTFDEQIVLYDEPGTASEVTYTLEARGRGFSQTQTVYVPATCTGTRTRHGYSSTRTNPNPPPDVLFGPSGLGYSSSASALAVCRSVAPGYFCSSFSYSERYTYECGSSYTTSVTVTSSRRCGLRARALLAAEQGDDIAIPPLH